MGQKLMTEFFVTGRAIDLILAMVVMEGAGLVAYRWKTGRGIASLDVVANLLAGASLMLALRCALAGAGWRWIALWMSAALLAHIADLWRRWRH
jgi:hypothetical protein